MKEKDIEWFTKIIQSSSSEDMIKNLNLFQNLKYDSKREFLKELNIKKLKIEIKNKIFEISNLNCKFLFNVIDQKFNLFKKIALIERQIQKNKEHINESLSQNVDWEIIERNTLSLEDLLKNLLINLKEIYSIKKIKSEKVFFV